MSKRNFTPHTYQRAERRSNTNVRQVEAEADRVKDVYPRLQFWSHTLFRVLPHTKATRFRVYTQRKLKIPLIIENVKQNFPSNTEINICKPYSFSHAFDVITYKPMRWDEFILHALDAFGDSI